MQKRCGYCLSVIDAAAQICPVCGKAAETNTPFHRLPVGTLLRDRYYIGAALGQGGFGITYAGYDTNLERKVAVKEYYPNGFVSRERTDPTVRVTGTTEEDVAFFEKGKKRFLDEAHTLAGFSGLEGVVDVHDCFAENNTVYIVMAFIEGVTLKDYLGSVGPLPAADALNLLMPVMTSLRQIHRKGLIHRDISPDNIMLSRDGGGLRVRLIDFGAARDVSSNGGMSLSVVLKPGFAPIEQYGSEGKQGPWTDVYALCATLYMCVTGLRPPAAPDRLQGAGLKTPSEAGAQIDANTERVLMKGLALNAAYRYRSIDELLKDLLDDEATITVTKESEEKKKGMPEDGPWEETTLITSKEKEKKDRKKEKKKDDDAARRRKRIVGASVAAAAVAAVLFFVILSGRSAAPKETRLETVGLTSENAALADPDAVASGDCGLSAGRVFWSLSGTGTLTVSGHGRMDHYDDDDEEDRPPWYDYRDSIRSVVVEEGVTALGSYAFWQHTALSSVSLPEGLTELGYHVFDGCSALTSVDLPRSLTEVYGSSFVNCTGLTEVNLHEGITEIGMGAFEGCTALKSVKMPDSIELIDSFSFKDCSRLADISVPDKAIAIGLEAFEGTFWYNAQPDGFVRLGSVLYQYKGKMPKGYAVTVGSDVKSIAEYAFSHRELSAIVIPDSVTVIGDGAFLNCTELKKAAIPSGVTEIGSSVFNGCEALTEITIPDGVTRIGYSAFENCGSLKSVTIPAGVTEIGSEAFSGCAGLTGVALPAGVTEIGSDAFADCAGLTGVSIPDGVTEIGSGAFKGCTALKDISLPDNTLKMEYDVFTNTAWYKAQPDGMLIIGGFLCGYKGAVPVNGTVAIPPGVKVIAAKAFEEQTGLAEAALPDSVQRICFNAFKGCTGLKSVSLQEGLSEIGFGAFNGCAGLTGVALPDSIEKIQSSCFKDCTALAEITFPDKAVNVSYDVFANTAWYNAQPEGIVMIGSVLYAYKGTMPALQKLTVGSGVKAVAGKAFAEQEGLAEAVIPEGVVFLGDSAFLGCRQLKSVTIPESVTEIGSLLPDVTVFGKAGSYAETWAEEKGLTFVAK